MTLVDGTLAGSATALSVPAGAVDGTALVVTRTAGTTAAVTVDVDLTDQPALPSQHQGYAFARALVGPAGDRPSGGGDAAGADQFPGHARRRAGGAHLGRAGAGCGRHAPRVPVQDERGLQELEADFEQRAGRDQRVRVHGDGARQRDGAHV